MNRLTRLTTTLLLTLPLAACVNYHDKDHGAADNDANAIHHEGSREHSINGSIHVEADQSVQDASTVNGSVRIDDGAQVGGGHSVNGSISLGRNASAGSLTTVNGDIGVAGGATVRGAVTTVNGTLSLHAGSSVGGRLSNVNGTILVLAANVGGGIGTVNGNIDIGANSHVTGGITVHRPATGFLHLLLGDNDKPRVVVGPGASVEGDLRFERAVRLYVSDSASIGPVTGATAIRFSGDHPPG